MLGECLDVVDEVCKKGPIPATCVRARQFRVRGSDTASGMDRASLAPSVAGGRSRFPNTQVNVTAPIFYQNVCIVEDR